MNALLLSVLLMATPPVVPNGAVGNGVADDRAALLAANGHAVTLGTDLRLAGGTYRVAGSDLNLDTVVFMPGAEIDADGVAVTVDTPLSFALRYSILPGETGVVNPYYPWFNVKRYGAIGDGVADDTVAIQAAFDTMLAISTNTGVGVATTFPTGRYLISDRLEIGHFARSENWQVLGQGRVVIEQATDNTEIIYIGITPGPSSEGWRISNFEFTWTNQQSSANPKSIAIAFDTDGNTTNGNHDFILDNLRFSNGFKGIATHPDVITNNYSLSIWGFTIRDCYGLLSMTGPTIYIDHVNAGAGPRCNFQNIYVQANDLEDAYPAFYVDSLRELLIENLEVNSKSNGIIVQIVSCGGVFISGMRFEACAFSNNFGALVDISGGITQAYVRAFELYNIDIDVADRCYGIRCSTGRVFVQDVLVQQITTTTGELDVLEGQVDGSITFAGSVHYDGTEGNTQLWRAGKTDGFENTCRDIEHLTFWWDGLNANQATTSAPCGPASKKRLMSRPGSVVGIRIRADSTITAGTLTVFASKNGTAIGGGGFNRAMTSGNNAGVYNPPNKVLGSIGTGSRFVPGDYLQALVNTDASFAAIGNNITIELVVAYTDDDA